MHSYPLYVSGTEDVRFEIPRDTAKKGIIRYSVTLPPYVTCSHCVVQWSYYTGTTSRCLLTAVLGFLKFLVFHLVLLVTGNMWGTCENGTEAVGCGRPETFRNCADVRIVTSTGGIPPRLLIQNTIFELYSVIPRFPISSLARPLRWVDRRINHSYDRFALCDVDFAISELKCASLPRLTDTGRTWATGVK